MTVRTLMLAGILYFIAVVIAVLMIVFAPAITAALPYIIITLIVAGTVSYVVYEIMEALPEDRYHRRNE